MNLNSRYAGSATVLVVGDGVLASKTVDVAAGDTKVTFPVDAKWGPGAYALAFLHRPLDVSAGRNPGRAIGLAWFGVDHAARTLSVKLEAPEKVRPENTLSVPVTLAGLKSGEEAYVTRRPGRCRHPQPHRLRDAGSGRPLSRPAGALHRGARPLWPARSTA